MSTDDENIADSASTLRALLEDSKRTGNAVPIGTAFVRYTDDHGQAHPGPLAALVRNHDMTALDLYLLFRAVATQAPYDVKRDARIWARALGHFTPKESKGHFTPKESKPNTQMISRAWGRLKGLGLITREPAGRLTRVFTRHESGTKPDDDYIPPDGGANGFYISLPFAYWTAPNPMHTELKLPGKAVLLILLSRLKHEFTVTADELHAWYGISPETAHNGLVELAEKEVLTRWVETKADPRSPTGQSYRRHYRFNEPYGRLQRFPEVGLEGLAAFGQAAEAAG